MKKQLYLLIIIVLLSNLIYAQESDADKLKIDKSKILSKLDGLALAQITVNYKLTTTAKMVAQEKGTRQTAGARISAFLETTDEELSANDFQEVTDYFYFYFQKKLKENGIDTVAWNTITATDFYKNAVDKDADEKKDESKEKGGNEWVTYTAHKGNTLHGKNELGFAFGKIKKGSSFCEEIGAPAGFFYLTVDFADVLVNLDIKTSREENMYYSKTTTKKTYAWAVKPDMRVGQPDAGLTLFWNKKSQSEILTQKKDMEGGVKYADEVSDDPSKARTGLAKQFAFSKELTPILIQTTREKYKAAAKKALEKYADAFVVKSQQLKND